MREGASVTTHTYSEQEGVLIAKVLRHAVKLLRKHGWGQRGAVAPDGKMCAGYAILTAAAAEENAADLWDNWDTHPLSYFDKYVAAHGTAQTTVVWNDTPGRTQQEVEHTMLTAAEFAEM